VQLEELILAYPKIVNRGRAPIRVVSVRLYSKRGSRRELIRVTRLDRSVPGRGFLELFYILEPGEYLLEVGYIDEGGRLVARTFPMALERRRAPKWAALLGAPVEVRAESVRGTPFRGLRLRGRRSEYECVELIHPPSLSADFRYSVFKCTDPSGAPYAAKVPTRVVLSALGSQRPTQLVSEAEVLRFRRELELFEERLKSVGHPHLLKLEDVAEEQYALVWEFCPYGSLRDLIAGGSRFTVREIAKVGVQVGSALMQLHQVFGGPHLDVKPENILVDSERRVKLGDFESMVRGRLRITPQYAAPEVFEERAGLESDAYSLALTLAELATGHTPRERAGADLVEVLRGSRSVSGRLREVLLAALERDPSRRLSLEEMVERLWELYALA